MKTIHKTALCLSGYFMCALLVTHAQQLISPAGNFFQGGAVSISFSMGEPINETFLQPSALLTQGFQQSFFDEIQIIDIHQGWNGISTWLIPANTEVSKIFQPLMNDLTLLRTMTGVFWPAQNINTLNNWNLKNGYMIKCESDYSLRIYGYQNNDLTVLLPQGWSLIPVLSQQPVPLSVFDPLLGKIKVVKEVAGWGVFWPEQNLVTLECLEPGKSYFVLMNSGGTLSFPIDSKHVTVKLDKFRSVNPRWATETNTPASHLVCLEKQALTAFSDGDFLGVFTSDGICSGQVEISLNNKPTVISVFGDDDLTLTKDGLFSGETMKFVWFNKTTGEETAVVPTFNPTLPDFIGAFVPNGLSSVSGFHIKGDAGFCLENPEISLFPNPCDGVFGISEIPSGTSIVVTDIGGRIVNYALSTVNGRLTIDMSGNPSGLYFVKIGQVGACTVKKVVLN